MISYKIFVLFYLCVCVCVWVCVLGDNVVAIEDLSQIII